MKDLREWDSADEFDVLYARFILSHLPDPADAATRFHRWLRPGGVVVVEDIDHAGAFTFPESAAFRRYCELYADVVRRRGGDADIGPRLPGLLKRAGFDGIEVGLTQPLALRGDVKLVHALTLENIRDAVVAASLATPSDADTLIHELHVMAADDVTLMATPRIVQTWARRS